MPEEKLGDRCHVTAAETSRVCYYLEHFQFWCSGSAVGEDEPGKEAEAGDAKASAMQADAAWRRRKQAGRY